MDGRPSISVIVPAFNARQTIVQTLASVAAQTLADFEAIVVNDGSTDGTGDLAREFAMQHPQFRVIDKANSGVADARNAGIRAAQAPLLAAIDADDLWHPQFLEKMSAALQDGGPQAAFAYASFRNIDLQGQVTGSAPIFEVAGRIFHQLLVRNFAGNGSGTMFWKEPAMNVGGYERRLHQEFDAQGCEDWLFQLRLAQRWTVVAVPEYLVGYRSVPGAMSANRLRMAFSRVRMLEIVLETIGDVHPKVWGDSMSFALTQLARELALSGRQREAARTLVRALRLSISTPVLRGSRELLRIEGRRFLRWVAACHDDLSPWQHRWQPPALSFVEFRPSEGKVPWGQCRADASLRRAAYVDRLSYRFVDDAPEAP